MKICGIEKISLVDYGDNVACTLFASGCNMRCPFCHNAPVALAVLPFVEEKEIFEYLAKRKNVLDGVCISGGEPTLHGDLPEFVSKIKDLGYKVKLDTNGSNPDMLKNLIEQNLVDYIAMDIKNCPDKYSLTAGCDVNLKAVESSLNMLIHGKADYELRTTIVKELHTLSDIQAMGEWINGAKRIFLQKFVAKDTCLADGLTSVAKNEAAQFCKELYPYVDQVALRGY